MDFFGINVTDKNEITDTNTEINIKSNEDISKGAFRNCTNLETIKLDTKVIGEEAFSGIRNLKE